MSIDICRQRTITWAQTERLAFFTEECSEAIQAKEKCIRHGLDDWSPFDSTETPNRNFLAKEIADVEYAIFLLKKSGDVSTELVKKYYDERIAGRGREYFHHQYELFKEIDND